MKVKMLKDHEGARAGDVVRFEDPREAMGVVAAGKAEPFDKAKHAAAGEDGRHGNPVGKLAAPGVKKPWMK